MNFLLDQNISHRVIYHLDNLYNDLSHVRQHGLLNASDLEIWKFASANNYDIITQDSDFNDIVAIKNSPPKIIWLRIGNKTSRQIAEILMKYKQAIDAFIEQNDYGVLEIKAV